MLSACKLFQWHIQRLTLAHNSATVIKHQTQLLHSQLDTDLENNITKLKFANFNPNMHFCCDVSWDLLMNFLFLLTTLLLLIRWVLLKPALMRFKTSLTPVVPKVCLEIWLTKSPKSKLQLITMLMHLVIEFLVQFACRLVFTLYIVNTTRCLYLELNVF